VLWPRAETWPASTRNALTDEEVSLSELRGFPIVLNFWASWCIPCGREAPRLNASARAHRGEVVFLGLDVKDFSDDARKFLRKHDTNYVSVRDGGSQSYDAYGLTGLPETYFLDGRGRIVAHKLGEIRHGELESGVTRALGSSK
jgi:cytochrome c biogenesis protein CcmG, thiol:disulfide interchange protein DsbE